MCFNEKLFANDFSGISIAAVYRSVQDTLQRNLNLLIPRKGIARPQSQFPFMCL
jgi:hypothetical protein